VYQLLPIITEEQNCVSLVPCAAELAETSSKKAETQDNLRICSDLRGRVEVEVE
jgi:hypothetical protein